MTIIKMTDLDLSGKRVLIREDLNVPVKDGKVASDKRIRASLPTIEHARQAGAKVMLMTHLGRPKEGEYDQAFSLAPVAEHLSGLLGAPVRLIKDWLHGIEVADGEVVLCENVRFNEGEKADDDNLARKRPRPTGWPNMLRWPVPVRFWRRSWRPWARHLITRAVLWRRLSAGPRSPPNSRCSMHCLGSLTS
jgi:hypothetical protein